jgi:hypothetical protein
MNVNTRVGAVSEKQIIIISGHHTVEIGKELRQLRFVKFSEFVLVLFF